ncbi:MAG: lipoate protein ligase C-terminal domain-containing protein [Desulfurococcaceae archaeon]
MKTYSVTLRFTKTVKLDVVFTESCAIEDVQISGDFFVYPEEALEVLENMLKGCSTTKCVEDAFSSIRNATILGFDLDSLRNKVVEALSTCSSHLPG